MIGAGSLGCQLLKSFAMMKIATNPNSLLTINDHDRIEKSNLNRQFLFRENNIGKLKSEYSINKIKQFNSKINCVSLEIKANKQNEKIFNKQFFQRQNAVIIAVDNFEASTYISKRCEKYNILYFNCGTDGPYANLEAFILGKTECASYPKDDNKIIPSCTLKMFPSSIDHCVLWALDRFEKFFDKNIINVKAFNYDTNKFYQEMDKILDLRIQFYKIKKYLIF